MLTAPFPSSKSDKYYVLYHDSMEVFADTLRTYTGRFDVPRDEIKWDLFDDGTDMIDIANPKRIEGRNVLFLANMESNSFFLAQLHLLNYIGTFRPVSLTIVLPFLTTGTMERIAGGEEGRVPTAVTTINLFNSLPQIGPPTLIVTYDIHALQEQFYFHHPAVAGLRSAIPLLIKELNNGPITCVAFPDDGANKRFASLFPREWSKIVCGKVRPSGGGDPVVSVKDGDPRGRHVIIVDDQTKSGGTFFSCIDVNLKRGASKVSAFVTHPVFNDPTNPNHKGRNNPNYKKAMKTGRDFWGPFTERVNQWKDRFGTFYITNSIPSVQARIAVFEAENPRLKGIFTVLNLAEQLAEDL